MLDSVAQGWVDINTFAYQSFVNCDLFSIDEIVDHLAEQVAEHGILTTSDLEFANLLWRRIREAKRQPQRKGFWNWLFG